MARKSKLAPEIIDRICELIKLRLSWTQIGHIVGISSRTLYNWRAKGEELKPTSRSIYRKFVDSINKAEAEAYEEAAAVFRKAMIGGEKTINRKIVFENGIPVKTEVTEKTLAPNWKAALAWLERSNPEVWGRYETLRLETDLRSEIESLGLEIDTVIAALMTTIEDLISPELLTQTTEQVVEALPLESSAGGEED